ncbi:hypothetical protein KBY66_14865 [Synechococcus sp. Tobar12-5m-g]|uniref:hypothetical protein n=1 Tax=unclassified Synechococcus TaxID=2626047 RepID=UPI0020CDBA43|nr:MULTISPECIES: hypothetical protein [unclassified Synechococcus]MCP9773872.1 hypothetical protein [Synechococcus sp. Tobar12-5m-g]MCP9874919.1 hypothetical protein [Synechococcus sp. Cruz CV-v-12]
MAATDIQVALFRAWLVAAAEGGNQGNAVLQSASVLWMVCGFRSSRNNGQTNP